MTLIYTRFLQIIYKISSSLVFNYTI